MKQDLIEKRLKGMLPSRVDDIGMHAPKADKLVKETAQAIKIKQDLKEIAKLKFAEKQKLKRMEAKQEMVEVIAEELGVEPESIESSQTEHQAKALAEQRQKIKAIEAIEEQTTEALSIENLTSKNNTPPKLIADALKLQGASRPAMTKLLTALNINMSVQLTKQDTANLLACLLTCNEAQLMALYNNKKIPIVIKTVIRRLQEDLKCGSIDTIEKLWDRVFGKGPMQLNLPEQQQLQTGIIPNMPISREAYVVIRDTLIK